MSVPRPAAPARSVDAPAPALAARTRRHTSSAIRDLLDQARRPGMVSMAGGLPDPAWFPRHHLAASVAAIVGDDHDPALQYGPTGGDPALRSDLAARAGVPADRIVITTGSQQALHLLAQVLVDPGDPVIVADPDYLGSLQAWRGAGGVPVGVPVDADGIDVDAIEGRLADGLRPALISVVPHFHNPTGVTLSATRRRRLVELARRVGVPVVFDDPYRDLRVGASAEPDGAAPGGTDDLWTIDVRSTSKILAPGLRVGWIRGPEWLMPAIERAKQSIDLHTSGLGQALVREALRSPWLDAHLAMLRAETGRRRDALLEALDTAFGDTVSTTRPDGGMFTWLTFRDGTDTTALLGTALDHGVAFVPGPAFATRGAHGASLRLSWATGAPDVLRLGVRRLAAAHAAARR